MVHLLMQLNVFHHKKVPKKTAHNKKSHDKKSHEKCKKCKKSFVIDKIPFNCSQPGVYKVKCNLTAQEKGGIGIIISSSDVYLDLTNHTVDMNNQGGTAILVSNLSNVQIVNGTIINSGIPTAVAPTNPDVVPDLTSATTPLDGYNLFLATEQANGLQNPLAIPVFYDCAAIGLQGSVSDIAIKNVTFINTFVGIAANAPVQNIKIDQCQAYDGGHNFGTELGNDGQRGGFAIFFNPNTDPNAVSKSDGIHISNCIGNSLNWQFGIALYSARDSSINACKMKGGTDTGLGSNEINCHALFFCDNCTLSQSEAWGGNDGFTNNYCSNCLITGCSAFEYTDQGIDIDTTKFCVVDGCKVSNLVNNSSVIPLANKGWGISAGFSLNVTIQNCESINNVKPFILGTEGAGIVLSASDSVVRNCICYGNNIGIALAGSQNCLVENSIANSNNVYGIVDESYLNITSLGNVYYRNEAQNNSTNPLNNFLILSIPPTVAVPTVVTPPIGVPVAPWANLVPL